MKIISISVSDHIYNTYLNMAGNRSRFIEKMILLGSDSELGNDEGIKRKLIEANQKIINQEDSIKKLNSIINKLKKEIEKKKKKEIEKKRFVEAE